VPKRGVNPSFKTISPSPGKERGIKGVRLLTNIQEDLEMSLPTPHPLSLSPSQGEREEIF